MKCPVLALALLVGVPQAAQAKDWIPEEGPRSAAAPAHELAPGVEPAVGPLAHDPSVVAAARSLGLARDYVQHVSDGLDLLYRRRYADTLAFFDELDATYPGTAVEPVAELLVWQARMLENFDFEHAAPYAKASAEARRQLEVAQGVPGNETWEHLMHAVTAGIESIHAARTQRYLPALSLAFEAIDAVERTRALAPDFADLALADGLYHYWRTVLAQRSALIPDFGDQRQQGLAEIQRVIDEGVFLEAPARLAMAFSWMQEGAHDKADEVLKANRAAFPESVINELTIGMNHLSAGAPKRALGSFDRVLTMSKGNRRAHYWRGLALFRMGKLEEADAAFATYDGFAYLEPQQRAWLRYRQGALRERQEAWGEAHELYKESVKLGGPDAAKAKMDALRQRRRAGEIAF